MTNASECVSFTSTISKALNQRDAQCRLLHREAADDHAIDGSQQYRPASLRASGVGIGNRQMRCHKHLVAPTQQTAQKLLMVLNPEDGCEAIGWDGERERIGPVRTLVAAGEQVNADGGLVWATAVQARPSCSWHATLTQSRECLVERLAFITEIVAADVTDVIEPYEDRDSTGVMRVGPVTDQLRQDETMRPGSCEHSTECVLAEALANDPQVPLGAQGRCGRSPGRVNGLTW